MLKRRTEIKCTVKGYPLHGITEVASQFSYCPLV